MLQVEFLGPSQMPRMNDSKKSAAKKFAEKLVAAEPTNVSHLAVIPCNPLWPYARPRGDTKPSVGKVESGLVDELLYFKLGRIIPSSSS